MRKARTYKHYHFSEKDPIISTLYRLVGNRTYREVEALSGVSSITLWHWFRGRTKRPQFATVMAVCKALDVNIKLVRKKK